MSESETSFQISSRIPFDTKKGVDLHRIHKLKEAWVQKGIIRFIKCNQLAIVFESGVLMFILIVDGL